MSQLQTSDEELRRVVGSYLQQIISHESLNFTVTIAKTSSLRTRRKYCTKNIYSFHYKIIPASNLHMYGPSPSAPEMSRIDLGSFLSLKLPSDYHLSAKN